MVILHPSLKDALDVGSSGRVRDSLLKTKSQQAFVPYEYNEIGAMTHNP